MTHPAPTSEAATQPGATSLLRLAALFARRWRFIALLGFTGAVIAAIAALVATPQFRASTRIALEEERSLANAGSLAALAGRLGGGTLGGVRSLQFYADVLVGRDLLSQLAQDTFPVPGDPTQRRPLMDILEIEEETPARGLNAAVRYLQDKAVNTTTNDRTGTITLDVALPDPQLAAAAAQRLYELLERFNFETRKTAASERREFAAREVVRARQELADAEASMRAFLEANRAGMDIPRLILQRQQHQRRIDLLNETYGRLSRELQEARVDEVRDMPVFTMVQQPVPPIYRDSPRRVRMTLIGAVLGGAAAALWIIIQASTRTARSLDPAGYEQLRSVFRRRVA